jgi:hypothetical protein
VRYLCPVIVSLGLLAVLLVATPAAADDDPLWAMLEAGGKIVMFRHATAPGMFDPPGMRLDDCATQRNLDEQGSGEARRIGEAFRVRQIPVAKVLSSQWCRCMETARLAFGRAEHWEPINGTQIGTPLEIRRTSGASSARPSRAATSSSSATTSTSAP